jgi:hypothetical protein
MAVNKKISSTIKSQLPDFIRSDHPVFQKFLEGYYEFLEQSNNAIDVSRNLLRYQDVDTSINKYIEYMKRELIPSLPNTLEANTQFILKRSRDLYRSRGSEKSYKLLFRLLYNDEIEIFDPDVNILRASDGRWVQENSIRVADPSAGNTELLLGQNITGLSSGATAKVERLTQTTESGFLVKELFLSNISGTFEDLEVVRNTSNTVNATIYNITGPIVSVAMLDKGAGHQLNDNVSFTSAVTIQDGFGRVSETDNFSAVQFSVANGGSGFIANSITTVVANTGSSGTGASFRIGTLKDTEIIAINTDEIRPLANVPLNVTGGVSNSTTNTAFTALGGNTSAVSANLATANVFSTLGSSLTFTNTTVGTINTVVTTSYGYNYFSLPTATITNPDVAELRITDGAGRFKGNNATISVSHVAGAIKAITIDNRGLGFNKYATLSITNNTRTPVANATGVPSITGLRSYEGKYTDTKGFLSWNNRLQDNFYYQMYSYVIKSDTVLSKYRQFVEDLLHPAGTKLFGEIRNQSVISLAPSVSSNVTVTSSSANTFDSTSLKFDSTNQSFDAF